MGYYAESALVDPITKVVSNSETANEPSDGDAYFCSSKGRTLVCLDFVLNNTDRDSINTGDYIVSFFILQNGNFSNVKGYDLNDKDGTLGLNLFYCPISLNGGDFKSCETSNIILDAGQNAEIKYVGVATFESENLDDPFYLTVSINNSAGESESFLYTVQ